MWYILLIGLTLISVLVFAFSCFNLMDNDKNEHGYNMYNSTLNVQCNAKTKCDWRYSTICINCKHNCGMKKQKNNFIAR